MKKVRATFAALAMLTGMANADHDSSVFDRVGGGWEGYSEGAWYYHHGFYTGTTSESLGYFRLTYGCRSQSAWLKSGEPSLDRVLRLQGLGAFAEENVRIRVGREIRRIRGTIENPPDDDHLALGSPDRVFGSTTVSPATLVIEATVFNGFDMETVVLSFRTDGFYEVLAEFPSCAQDDDA